MIYCVSECINVSHPKPILFFLFVQIYCRDVLHFSLQGCGCMLECVFLFSYFHFINACYNYSFGIHGTDLPIKMSINTLSTPCLTLYNPSRIGQVCGLHQLILDTLLINTAPSDQFYSWPPSLESQPPFFSALLAGINLAW